MVPLLFLSFHQNSRVTFTSLASHSCKKVVIGDLPGGSVVKTPLPGANARGSGWIPSQGTKIPHTLRHSQKTKNKKVVFDRFYLHHCFPSAPLVLMPLLLLSLKVLQNPQLLMYCCSALWLSLALTGTYAQTLSMVSQCPTQ